MAEAPGGRPASRATLGRLVAGSFVTLGLLILVILLHAYTSIGALIPAVEGLAVLLTVLAVASVLDGIYFAWRRYPQHRRAMIFIIVITSATLVAHAYIIGNPPASNLGTISGAVGSTISDSRLTVNSSVVGQQLLMTVDVSGSNAIAQINVTNNGTPLSSRGLTSPPSFSSPLEPGASISGNWTLSPTENATQITINYQYLTCYDTSDQVYGCIMDEVFYVPAAQHMLAGAQCTVGAPRDTSAYCNPEHPPLTKALIAAGMAIFGAYSAVGWRFMIALLGSFSIPLIFGIAWKVSGSKKLAFLSALLLSLDVLFFSQSSGALLDIPPVFFGLAAFFVYVANLRWWKFDRYIIAGVLLGAAALSKETAIFTVMALVSYILFFGGGTRLGRLYSALKVGLVVVLVFAGGMQAYDSALASTAFPTFVQHVSYMLSYGSSLIANKLACQPTTGYWCLYANDPGGPPILPIDWLLYYSPIGYYIVSVTVNPGNLHFVSIGYYGVTNLLETWTTFIWVPLVAYTLYRYFRSKQKQPSLEAYGFDTGGAPQGGMSGDTRFAAFALNLFFWTYVPYLFLFLGGRVTYPFYFVDAVPAVAMGASYWLSRNWFPKWLLVLFLVMVFVFFFVYFPDKAFLPNWLRALIGH